MLRILKFIGAFLAAFLLIFLIVFGFNMNALITLFENSEDIQEGQEWVTKASSLKGLTEYIGTQPERVSIASIAINNSDSSLLYNEHAPRTMGQLSNIFVLIEYARQVEDGSLNADEKVPLEEVKTYLLPYMDASNHENAIASLRDQGKVSNENSIPLKSLVQTAIEFNDPAISDYLLIRLGRQQIDSLMDKFKLKETELPLPFSGLYITLNPSIHETDFKTWMDSLRTMPRVKFDSLVMKSTRQLETDQTFREKVVKQFKENEGMGIQFTELRDMLDFFPKTTAFEMAMLIKNLQQEKLISEAVSKRVKKIMSWPMESSRLQNDFKTYGAIYDSRMGLANGLDFGQSAYSEEPFAQAIFFDELQIAFWFHMTSNLMHQDFEQRLIWDPALREATKKAIKNAGNQTAETSKVNN